MNTAKLINQLMAEHNINQVELAKLSGIAQSSISDYITGKYVPKQDKIYLLAKAFGVSPAIFFDVDDEVDFKNIPIMVNNIAAGLPLFAEDNIKDYFKIDNRIDANFIVQVKGDSMIDAGILSGDYAFIKSQPMVENGEIAAVLINDSATLKRVYYENGILQLRSENSKFCDMVFNKGNVRVLGKLVAVLNIR